MQPIEQQIRDFINDNFLFGQGTDSLSANDSFLDQGIIDSTGVLELVTFIEGQFGIQIADNELVPQNLDSIENLVRFITRKQEEIHQPA
ncbi:MAG: acyl carrier protein [Planctomycetia bacterium]|nr:acyl carrier protein [Planctomycetia bacterium]